MVYYSKSNTILIIKKVVLELIIQISSRISRSFSSEARPADCETGVVNGQGSPGPPQKIKTNYLSNKVLN